jgi:Ca2+-transporting ATPase
MASAVQPDKVSPPNTAWHALPTADVIRQLESDSSAGLSPAEASSRLALHGANRLEEQVRRSWPMMLLAQFTDVMVLVLLVAALIAALVGEPVDAIAIFVIVILNAGIGFVQEFRAERAMEALRSLAAHRAHVVRGGEIIDVAADGLVPGDIVALEAGDVVPADIRMTESARLQAEEASLTGESMPVEKRELETHDADAPLGDRHSMVYKSTLITRGRGKGIVVATGMRTELGRIAKLLSAESGKTPLQKRLTHFGRRLAALVIVICAVIFVAGWLRGEPLMTMFLTAVSLAVAAIPEALPAVVTISLALGAARMVDQQALIRRLPAVETLGSVTVICSDKTGTLTENRMTLTRTFVGGMEADQLGSDDSSLQLAMIMALCNDAHRGASGDLQGDPTETALLDAIPADQFDELQRLYPRLGELPFESERARMSTFHSTDGGVLMLVKGAPEALLPLADAVWKQPDKEAALAGLEAKAAEMAANGQRVLAFARKYLQTLPDLEEDAEAIESGLEIVGLAALMDPPREEARQAVAQCQRAGITPMMITGDHPETARAIAATLGIAPGDTPALTGKDLARMSDAQLGQAVETARVYARISPEQKIRIVEALQGKGEFVAMTGDGVNDAPALKQADIGIAMGCIGTEVAREAASMVLLDDNFATIVRAVREGRRIFDNIRHFVKYTMTSNAGEIWTLFLAPFLGLPIPLLPIHILWINLLTDGLPGLALAAEPEARDIMRRPPRSPQESLFAGGMWQHILWVGLLIGGLSIFTQAWAIRAGSEHWQSMVFTVLTLSQMANVLAIRSESESLFSIGLLSNKPLLLAILLSIAMQLAVLYVPFLQPIFGTGPLSLTELGFCVAVASVVFIAVETGKYVSRRQR